MLQRLPEQRVRERLRFVQRHHGVGELDAERGELHRVQVSLEFRQRGEQITLCDEVELARAGVVEDDPVDRQRLHRAAVAVGLRAQPLDQPLELAEPVGEAAQRDAGLPERIAPQDDGVGGVDGHRQ